MALVNLRNSSKGNNMRFNNAFMCKSGVLGMQFNYGKNEIVSVFHDGKELRTSEDVPVVFQLEARRRYHLLHNRFVRHEYKLSYTNLYRSL